MEVKEDDNVCIVCWREIQVYAIGLCDHPVCHECSTRMRVLCRKSECPICRRNLPKVILVRECKPFEELNKWLYQMDARPQMCFQDESVQQAYKELLENRCKYCPPGKRPVFNNLAMLRTHIRKEHHRAFCDLCVEHLKIFPGERRAYSRKELERHLLSGDLEDTSHKGHPLCQFCEVRYFDNDELYRHLRQEHYYCHFCGDDYRLQYYRNYDYLRAHLRQDHFLCEEGDCRNETFTAAFRSEIDLKAHRAQHHNRSMTKAQVKQTRTLDLEINFTPRPSQLTRAHAASSTASAAISGSQQEDGGSHGRRLTRHGHQRPNRTTGQDTHRSEVVKAGAVNSVTMASSSSSSTSSGVKTNKLANERSPYLLQHAKNPVDWYPWGQDAIAKAKAEDKPIFLSVGYSTCHWCHVMERESFENEDIAKVMNEHFVNIKVDREERPDIDRIYMTYIQATSGGGGWPMSVWLTPDLTPIVGGTYFPPDDRYFGRPGFKTLLTSIAEQWKKNRAKLMDQGNRIVDILRQASKLGGFGEEEPAEEAASTALNAPEASVVASSCFGQLDRSYDESMGGFGKAPKFPQCANLNFLLRYRAWLLRDPAGGKEEEAEKALEMCDNTLKKMARGGIHDHVAKGFHRYSTDSSWHVPHFEKMLYDQAQLARAYLEAHQVTHDPLLAQVARDILTYVERDLSHQSGGFYSAEDADSLPTASAKEKQEGAFCVWEEEEVQRLLVDTLIGCPSKTLADLFCHYFGVKPDGNVDPMQDPHDELKRKNVLIVRQSTAAVADHFGMEPLAVEEALCGAKQILLQARLQRPKPHLDDKFLTSWNGLMISGFATAAKVLGQAEYAERALKGVAFLRRHLYNADEKLLLRSAYRGEDGTVVQTARPIAGVLEDYAFVIQGLLDTYESCWDQSCLLWAEELQDLQDTRFWDPEQGGYFLTSGADTSVIIRLKDDQDGAEPSANSVSLSNLVRLSVLLNRPELRLRAERLAAAYSRRLALLPMALPEMVCGLLRLQAGPQEIVIAGAKDGQDTQELLSCLRGHFLPFVATILADQNPENPLCKRLPSFDAYRCVDGKATAYVCQNFICSKPVTTTAELEIVLAQK